MDRKAADKNAGADVDVGRRTFVKQGGAALATSVGLAGATADAGETQPGERRQAESAEARARPWRRPNLVFLITDQERYPQHWPEGWAEANLPNRRRLAEQGLSFTSAFCNAAMCSPSRASFFTGLYATQTGVTEVLQYGGPWSRRDPGPTAQTTLQPDLQNMGRMLRDAGYDVQYRGKWHLSKDPTGTLPVQSPRDLERYGFRGWVSPDAGTSQEASVFGGGDTNYDAEYARQAAQFLRDADPGAARPFALFICLANPHDLMGYPDTWDEPSYSDIPPYEGSHNYRKDAPHCFRQGIDLPATIDEPPFGNFKPPAQGRSTLMWAALLGPLPTERRQRDYVNFYAWVTRESDRHFGTVLDALQDNHGLREKTVVLAFSDHGEMGLAHGGMREKAYNAYEETIHIPLVIANPLLFPRAVRTDALASLIDLMPTVATFAEVRDRERYTFMGVDLMPVIRDAIEHPSRPTRMVQDAICFTTDEIAGEKIVGQPGHIRCLRESRWKIAEYFDPSGVERPQYELYDLVNDPLELHNMGNRHNHPYFDPVKLGEMIAKLHRRFDAIDSQPIALDPRR